MGISSGIFGLVQLPDLIVTTQWSKPLRAGMRLEQPKGYGTARYKSS